MHEGNGKALQIVDEKATAAQRSAIEALLSGQHGGAAFEIFSAVTPNKLGTVSAPITFVSDRETRVGKISSAGVSFELANTYAQLNRFEWKSAA